jgi:hypothetical protein
MRYETKRDESTLKLRLTANTDPLRDAEQLQLLLQAFDDAAALRPEVAVGSIKGDFDLAKLGAKFLRAGKKMFPSMSLRRENPNVDYYISVTREFNKLYVNGEFVTNELADRSRCEDLIGLVKALARQPNTTFARAHDSADLELSDRHRPDQVLLEPSEIDDVYWLTLWGPELVNRAGRERVLSTPAYRIEELPSGAVLLLTRPTPSDVLEPEGRRAQAKALAHLRPERSEDEIYEQLMQRSRQLAPVEKRFDPDVAPFFDVLTAEAGKVNRGAEIERLNAYKVPPVVEVSDPPLPSQGDAKAAVEAYDDRAEQLIALLRKQVPDIETFEPRVLPLIDYWCWNFSFAAYDRKDVENDLVPALGAYVALVMIKHLGGTLVPRKKLDESQVVIGGRAYLPFLRARHALATREAQLDYSMTQLIEVAKRSR